MADYAITFARSARKELEALEQKQVERVFHRIEGLGKEPRPSGCRKLVGSKLLWRIRIGDYRIVYAVYDDRKVVDIVAVRHRKDVYQQEFRRLSVSQSQGHPLAPGKDREAEGIHTTGRKKMII